MVPVVAQAEVVLVCVVFVALIIMLILTWFCFSYGMLYVKALLSDAPVGIFEIMGMRLREVWPATIVDSRIMAAKTGLELQTHELETHYLAGGNVPNVVRALVAAGKAGLPLTFDEARAIDLAGADLLLAVMNAVNPKIVECSDSSEGYGAIRAVAGDGVELEVAARLTLRANLSRAVGGTKEDVLVARLGDAIADIIESADTGDAVRKNRGRIAEEILSTDLDADSACDMEALELRVKRA